MSAEKLSRLVSGGDLKITYILSPPRTLSTVLSIALAENADGQVHEPLSFRRRDSFDEGCQLIVDRVEQLRPDADMGQQPLHLVVKDLTKNVRPEEWQKLTQLAGQFVFVIREPTRQMYSLIRRRVTEALSSYRSPNLSDDETLSGIEKVSQDTWIDGSWHTLELFLDDVEKTKGLQDKTVIISGLSLRLDALGTMRRISEKFGWLPFNDKLTGGWTKAVGRRFYNPPFKELTVEYDDQGVNISGWIHQAIQSTSFLPLSKKEDRPVDIGHYPQRTQKHILDQIFPVYVRMLLHPLNISRPTIEDIVALGDINPIEAYVLLKGYKNLSDAERRLQDETTEQLEKSYNKLTLKY